MSAKAFRPGVALAVTCLGIFVISLDLTIVNVALPTLSRRLGASNAELQWIVDAYSLTTAALLLSAGNLGDRYGRRGWLNIGLAIVAVTSVMAACADSAASLIAARAAMGIGAAIIYPTSLALISNMFDGARRARAIGVWAAMTGIGIVVGPIAGGWLIESVSVGSVFWLNVPIALVAIAGATLFVPTSRNPVRTSIDLWGLLLSAAGLAVLTFTLIEGPGAGWLSGRTFTGFALAAVLLAAFLRQERRSPFPMLDLSIFADRRFAGGSIAVTTCYLTLCGFVFVMTHYLQFVTTYTPLQTGVRLLPLAVSVAAASVAAPRLAQRWGTTFVITAGLVVYAAAIAWSGTFNAATPYLEIGATMAMLGAGCGFTMAPATEAIMGSLSPATAGVESAVAGATRQVGGTLGVALIGSVYASVYSHRLNDRTTAADISPDVRASLRGSMAEAEKVLGQLPAGTGRLVRGVVESAFLDAVWASCLACAGVAVALAVVVAIVLPGNAEPASQRRPAAPAEGIRQAL
ncbi:MFS transporter [Mycobacterium camsae]|uniref:MFS transporter n=1 Tax=Mycobacterium gordonae TaxID=1778 RepID=UPI0019809C10|nr:MFS transporter [Mycobacterium gordonae]